MHGKSFQSFATRLASDSCLVIAPDLRGFGRWYFNENERSKIDYQQSLEDLSALFHHYETQYPELPIFCAGESLGAHFARQLSLRHTDKISGLILSSPCVRPRIFSLPLFPSTCKQIVVAGISGEELNLSSYARKFLEQEPDGLKDYLDDPLSRKSLEILELIDSMKLTGFFELRKVPSQVPILVLRGANDFVCNSSSAKKFIDSLGNQNTTVLNCGGCGHLILQKGSLDENVYARLRSWVLKQSQVK